MSRGGGERGDSEKGSDEEGSWLARQKEAGKSRTGMADAASGMTGQVQGRGAERSERESRGRDKGKEGKEGVLESLSLFQVCTRWLLQEKEAFRSSC